MNHTPSPVAVATSKHKALPIIAVAFISSLMMLLLWLALKSPAKVKTPLITTTHEAIPKPTLLADNLAALEQQEKRLSKPPITIPQHVITIEEDQETTRLRQHAPTTLFVVDHRQTASEQTITHASVLNETDPYTSFANQPSQTVTVHARRIEHPSLTIAAGEFIPAVLETAIHSDLPGRLRAVVTRPVYGYVGHKELIPAGSRLIGQYVSAKVQGQRRLFVIWDRVVLPDGVAVQIQSPGIDALGRTGVNADHVQTHFWERFGESLLLSIIGASVTAVGVEADDRLNSESYYRIAVAESLNQTARQSLQQNAGRPPTLTVDQGKAIVVFVAHDLSFHAILGDEHEGIEPFIGATK
jgi:type IV secretion system protein VirB10